MNTEQLHELLNWMNNQLNHINRVINESHEKNNYGREALFEGKRDAYLELMRKINHQASKKSTVS